jgi:hypothetical protein
VTVQKSSKVSGIRIFRNCSKSFANMAFCNARALAVVATCAAAIIFWSPDSASRSFVSLRAAAADSFPEAVPVLDSPTSDVHGTDVAPEASVAEIIRSTNGSAASDRWWERDCSFTLGVTSHDEVVLPVSLQTWEEAGILDLAGEIFVYLNNRRPSMDRILDRYRRPGRSITVLGDGNNPPASLTYAEMIEKARSRFFLYLERDFRSVEAFPRVLHELGSAMDAMNQGHAHYTMLRSRRCEGVPNYAKEVMSSSDGSKEARLCERQGGISAHACYVWHWRDDNFLDTACSEVFQKCGVGKEFRCVASSSCAFSLNPHLLRREWFAQYIHQWRRFDFSGRSPASNTYTPFDHMENFLSLPNNCLPEYGCSLTTSDPDGRRRDNNWAKMNATCIVGEGLFRHDDVFKRGETDHEPCTIAGTPDYMAAILTGAAAVPEEPTATSPTRCRDWLIRKHMDRLWSTHVRTARPGTSPALTPFEAIQELISKVWPPITS